MGETSAVRAIDGEPAHTVHTVQNHDRGPKRDGPEMRLRAGIHAAYACCKIHMAMLTQPDPLLVTSDGVVRYLEDGRVHLQFRRGPGPGAAVAG